ncbi:hypothetical protein HPB48_021518 [Haemaphysalis longicornis]|uniref:Uncharacterized protein n=1 Tax=Haemaphysalis longicornis TaxID=44386 RepID=A0A9J6G2A7_HAELO|nr:hypothetical protein HPB48_021518 [Haemaphysalis longicornis]
MWHRKLFKSLARLRHLGCSAVDAVLDGPLADVIGRRETFFTATASITESRELSRPFRNHERNPGANGCARVKIKGCLPTLGILWETGGSGFRLASWGTVTELKPLRLRANLYPTRYLFNRGARDPKARLWRRCGTHEETTFHILQKCTSIHSPRIVRHNFIEQAIIKKLSHPSGGHNHHGGGHYRLGGSQV